MLLKMMEVQSYMNLTDYMEIFSGANDSFIPVTFIFLITAKLHKN